MLQEPQDDQVCEYASTCLARPNHNCDQCRRDVCLEHFAPKYHMCVDCLARKWEHEEVAMECDQLREDL